jgi:hypothetical protein
VVVIQEIFGVYPNIREQADHLTARADMWTPPPGLPFIKVWITIPNSRCTTIRMRTTVSAATANKRTLDFLTQHLKG